MAVLVTGAGGFIGGALVSDLLRSGREVRAVDCKPLEEWFVTEVAADNRVLDLRELESCRVAADGCAEVYNLAADMGGMGFIETHKADCMLSVLISTHMFVAAKDAGVRRFFYSSSACVYAEEHQIDPAVTALVETDAYPAMPEDGYGWEKLFGERMARHFLEDFGLETRVARYHNVYGPSGTFDGGREKAPAAICRKVAKAVLSGDHRIEIWGDGKQTRSFTYIDDCVHGTQLIMAGDSPDPVNLGSSELVSINDVVTLVEDIAGVTLERSYNLTAPQGVRGRNSDNTLIKARYGWEPTTTLRSGLKATYEWIHEQLRTTS
jgi:nucleoside-diphosphate-sugar epimerase